VPEAYWVIAQEEQVPATILYAIALTESGMRIGTGSFRPFPWTVVSQGKSLRFNNRIEAIAKTNSLLASGVTNIDVGLMQTNLHWHGYRFKSVTQALDPWVNVRNGARILRAEQQRKRCKPDWWCAVGRYHSYRPEAGRQYAARVRAFYQQLKGR
jgi:hypothetical protein